ncbi:hypothetical protein Tco_1054725 [Tanacetum coccineum]|uniref:Uncharacterized protein n=1 Tax=Tanacetum coccineum TaxID=301880 RepID=A0ABQ5GXL1_9ASTR
MPVILPGRILIRYEIYSFLRLIVDESLDVVAVVGDTVAVNSSETVLSEDEIFLGNLVGTDNQEKNEKQSQNNKTGLGMEKTVKDKAKSKPESQSSQKVNRKVNWCESRSESSESCVVKNTKAVKKLCLVVTLCCFLALGSLFDHSEEYLCVEVTQGGE